MQIGRPPSLSPLIVEACADGLTSRQVYERLADLTTYVTVRTLVLRLVKKGLLHFGGPERKRVYFSDPAKAAAYNEQPEVARALAHARATAAPRKPRPSRKGIPITPDCESLRCRDALLLLAQRPGGFTLDEACNAGWPKPLVQYTLSKRLRELARAFPRHSNFQRYFDTQERADAWAQAHPMGQGKPKAPRSERKAAPKRQADRPARQLKTVVLPKAPPKPRTLLVDPDAPAITPAHVKVTKCPPVIDRRFVVTEPIDGGFHAEWLSLRGQAHQTPTQRA
jgi:hypothetical protein